MSEWSLRAVWNPEVVGSIPLREKFFTNFFLFLFSKSKEEGKKERTLGRKEPGRREGTPRRGGAKVQRGAADRRRRTKRARKKRKPKRGPAVKEEEPRSKWSD